jgi:cytochrome c553
MSLAATTFKHTSIMRFQIVTVAVGAVITLITGSSVAAEVGANWEKHCLKCHGKDGKGNTRMGRQSGVKDYTDAKVQEAMKDDQALKAVKEGIMEKGKEKMKAYAGELSDEEIKALIAHMRTFKK